MPHFVLEHSTNILERYDNAALCGKLHRLLATLGPFEISAMKSRVVPRADFYVGDGEPNRAFIHLELAVLSGREPTLLSEVSRQLHQFLLAEFSGTATQLACSFTVEVREMDARTYSKLTS